MFRERMMIFTPQEIVKVLTEWEESHKKAIRTTWKLKYALKSHECEVCHEIIKPFTKGYRGLKEDHFPTCLDKNALPSVLGVKWKCIGCFTFEALKGTKDDVA